MRPNDSAVIYKTYKNAAVKAQVLKIERRGRKPVFKTIVLGKMGDGFDEERLFDDRKSAINFADEESK